MNTCRHQLWDPNCESNSNLALLAATGVMGASLFLPESQIVRQVVVSAYLLLAPGLAAALWVKQSHQPLLSALSLMLIFPLSFTFGVLSSLMLVYTGLWSPLALAGLTATAVSVSSVIRIARHVGPPRSYRTLR